MLDATEDELLRELEAEAAAQAPPPPTPSPRAEPPAIPSGSAYALFRGLTGNDILGIFADTGAGKSKIVSTLALEAARAGQKVLFWDLEGNLHPSLLKAFREAGIDYRRVKRLSEVYRNLKDKADLMVVDSATLQITGRWFFEGQNERGKILQEVQGLYQVVKDWCETKGGMAIIVSQPVSEFGGRGLGPMGDKARFFIKEELYLDYEREEMTVKRRDLRVFKSRVLPEGTMVCTVKTTATGVEFGVFNPEVKNAAGL